MMAEQVLYRIDCPYSDCSENRLVLVHKDAVSRLQGLDRVSHKRWVDDEVYESEQRSDTCTIH